jgi:tetratricopeptide (TPR) repeat protein
MPETESKPSLQELTPRADANVGSSGIGSEEVTRPGGSEAIKTQSTRGLSRLRIALLSVMLIVGISVAAIPVFYWWHARQTRFYSDACQAASEAESWERLKRISTEWVEWDPTSSEGWVHVADARLKLSEFEAAADAMARVDESHPNVLRILEARGDLLFSELNRPYEAVENWRHMLEIDELSTVARQRLIYFYAITMQREKMREEILRAMELRCEPLESYAYLLLAYEVTFSDGLRLTRKWLESYPEDETLKVASAVYLAKFAENNTIRVLGTRSVGEGDLSVVSDYLETYPDNLEILAFHLEKAVFEGDENRVVEILGMCPPSAERDCRFWRARGWLLALRERYDEAAVALEKCIELNPFDWRGRLFLSGVLRQLGRFDEANLHSDLQTEGKELQEILFLRPNARSIDQPLANRIFQYAVRTGPEIVPESLAWWIEQGGLSD